MLPVLVRIGPITIYSYTVCMLTAFLLVGWLSFREAKRRERLTNETLLVGSIALLSAILGAKLGMIVFLGPAEFWREISTIPSHGSALWGGLVIGYISVILTERALKVERCTGDLIAPFLPLGQAIGRLGNFLAGDAYGLPSSLPWSVYQAGAYRHPVQIYEMIPDLVLFAFLWRRRYVSFRDGELFSMYVIGYSVIRFPLEFLRYQPTPLYFLGLTLVQWLCILAALWMSFQIFQQRRGVNGCCTVTQNVPDRKKVL